MLKHPVGLSKFQVFILNKIKSSKSKCVKYTEKRKAYIDGEPVAFRPVEILLEKGFLMHKNDTDYTLFLSEEGD